VPPLIGTVPVIFRAPLPIEIMPPFILIPFDDPLLESDEVPCKVMVPIPVVLNVPVVREIPWEPVELPVELAVICTSEVPIVPKFAAPLKPMLLGPEPPAIPLVAVMAPPVEKAAPTLIPFPPVPVPPLQFSNVTRPIVPVVQEEAIATP
jgi:hypothetical protein